MPSASQGGGEAARRHGPLADRLAEQGAFLFRRRGLFGVFLLPPIALALFERWAAGPAAPASLAWWCAWVAIAALGELIRIATVCSVHPESSGRDTQMPRAPVLNRRGTYSVVRHPIYLGNLLVLVGLMAALREPWLVLVSVLVYCVLFERIILAEEAFLGATFGEEFHRWAAQTPTFWPDLRRFRRPDWPFAWASAWSREYNTIHGLLWGFALARCADRVLVGRVPIATWVRQDSALVWALAVALPLFMVLRALSLRREPRGLLRRAARKR